MAKKHQYGPLYEHAKRELELAGVTTGKGNIDQKLSGTTLKLVDIFERSADSELLRTTIRNLFTTFTTHNIINPPTDDPDEWQLMEDNRGKYLVLRRCNEFKSRDGGISWYRDDGSTGVSVVVTKGDDDGSSEEKENV